MAVTKIWPVKGKLNTLIRYAENEQKTRIPNLTGLSHDDHDDLSAALEYAADKGKTVREQQLFVSGVNCLPETCLEQMNVTKKQFGKEGGVVGFHAYQSFHPGEVTPEQCHQIGVETARRMWGDRFEVIVATHLNTDCCHNHFVLNSVSFKDGKRYNDCRRTYSELRAISDGICRERGLSVVEHTTASKTPRSLYLAEKSGEPTRYNVMRADIDRAVEGSLNMKGFWSALRQMGYEIDNEPNHKYATIRMPGTIRATRFKSLGEEYTDSRLRERVEENYREGGFLHAHRGGMPCFPTSVLEIILKESGLLKTYHHYCYLLGAYPERKKYRPLHPALREDMRRLDATIEQMEYIERNHIETTHQLKEKTKLTSLQLNLLQVQRYKRYNRLRRCNDPEQRAAILAERDVLSVQIKDARREVKLLTAIPERVKVMEKNMALLEERDRSRRQTQYRRKEHEMER